MAVNEELILNAFINAICFQLLKLYNMLSQHNIFLFLFYLSGLNATLKISLYFKFFLIFIVV